MTDQNAIGDPYMLACEPTNHVVDVEAIKTLTRINQRIDQLRKKYGPELVLTLTLTAHLPARKLLP